MAVWATGRRGLRDMIQPFDTGFIYATTAAGVVHEVYYEQCGNPNVRAPTLARARLTWLCGRVSLTERP